VLLRAWYLPVRSKRWQYKRFVTDRESSCVRKFLTFLHCEANHRDENHMLRPRSYKCFAHNASRFDHFLLMADMTPLETRNSQPLKRGTSIIKLEYLGHQFFDSMCFLSGSLSRLCESFKTEHGKQTTVEWKGLDGTLKSMSSTELCFYTGEDGKSKGFWEFIALQETEPGFWKAYEDYCLFDCIALQEIWFKLKENYETIVNSIDKRLLRKVPLESCPTIAGIGDKLLKNYNGHLVKHECGWLLGKDSQTYGVVDGFIAGDKDKEMFLALFKRGGLSVVLKPGKYESHVVSYDMTSQYPASIMQMMIPCGRSRWVKRLTPNTFGFYHVQNVTIPGARLKPFAVKGEDGTNQWELTNASDLYLSSYMLDWLSLKHPGFTCTIVRGLVSNQEIRGCELFGPIINGFFAAKQGEDNKKAQGKPFNTALREVAKLIPNALTGRLVMDKSGQQSIVFGRVEGKPDVLINGNVAHLETDPNACNNLMHVGIMCYDFSKRYLFGYIDCLGPDPITARSRLIASETDSIYFPKCYEKEFLLRVEAMPNNFCVGKSVLGGMEKEHDSEIENMGPSYFLRKKFYKIGESMKCKGIPKKSIMDDGTPYDVIVPDIYQTVYEGKTYEAEFKAMQRVLYGDKVSLYSHRMTRRINPSGAYRYYYDDPDGIITSAPQGELEEI
jgi:hypothetical protein